MTTIASEKPSIAVFLMVIGVAIAASFLVASSNLQSSVVIVVGTIACVLAFINAELAIYFLIVAMLLSPELEVGETERGASLGRAVTLRVDDFLILIIAGTWFLKSALYKEIDLIKHTSLNATIYVYALACMISTMLGMLEGQVSIKTGSLFVLKYIEYFLIFFMVVNITHDEAQVRRFLILIFTVALIVSLVGISQIPSGQRVSAPFEGKSGEPNTMGGYLLLMLATLGGIVLVYKKYRAITIPLLCVFTTAFLYTLSRASYLGVIPILLLLPLLTRRYVLLAAASAFLICAALIPRAILPAAVVKRIEYTFTQKTSNPQALLFGKKVDTSTTARLEYMQAAVDAFYEHPLFGWGVTGWHFIDSQYFRTLVETGLIGMTAFVVLLAKVLKICLEARERFKTDPLFFGLTSGFLAGFVGLLLHAIGSNTFIIVRIMEPFWLLVGLIAILSQIHPLPEERIQPAG
jgi:O-antigen ligase